MIGLKISVKGGKEFLNALDRLQAKIPNLRKKLLWDVAENFKIYLINFIRAENELVVVELLPSEGFWQEIEEDIFETVESFREALFDNLQIFVESEYKVVVGYTLDESKFSKAVSLNEFGRMDLAIPAMRTIQRAIELFKVYLGESWLQEWMNENVH